MSTTTVLSPPTHTVALVVGSAARRLSLLVEAPLDAWTALPKCTWLSDEPAAGRQQCSALGSCCFSEDRWIATSLNQLPFDCQTHAGCPTLRSWLWWSAMISAVTAVAALAVATTPWDYVPSNTHEVSERVGQEGVVLQSTRLMHVNGVHMCMIKSPVVLASMQHAACRRCDGLTPAM